MNVEKGVPIPERGRVVSQFPSLRGMGIGDSFLIAGADENTRCYVFTYAERQGVKVTTRKEASGIRVWRIA